MSDPSIIFYQGLRCTKVPRQPRATDPPSPSQSETDSSSITSTAPDNPASSAERPDPDPASTQDTDTSTVASVASNHDSEKDPFPSHTSSQTSDSYPSSLDIATHSTATDSLVALSTSTDIPTTSQTSTSIPEPIPSTSDDDDDSGPPYATIFGTIFGILGFITLVATLFFLYRRRRRRNSTKGWSSQKENRNGRDSTDSSTTLRRDYRSQSYLSDASPTSATLFQAVYTKPENQKAPPRYSDPFSDMAEVPQPAPFTRALTTYPNEDTTQPAYHPVNRESGTSFGSSLGSTLVLPGRSSMGSDMAGTTDSLYFPKPPASSTPSFPKATAQRDSYSTRSNPFDLEDYPVSESRRSSGALPGVLF
ncbi:hypothetical protein BJX99DRAFT_193158 [Aspergillus californicus]